MRSSASVRDLMLVKAYLEFYCFQEGPKGAFSPRLTFLIHHVICYASFFAICGYFMDAGDSGFSNAFTTPQRSRRTPTEFLQLLSFFRETEPFEGARHLDLSEVFAPRLEGIASELATLACGEWKAGAGGGSATSRKAKKRNAVTARRHVTHTIPAGSEAGQNHILSPNPLCYK